MKPYPAYKDSGVAWIGEVPEEWEVAKLKWVAAFHYGDSLSAQDRGDGDVPVYGSNGIVGTHSQAITKAPCIIVGRKGSFGKVNFSEIPCFPIDTTFFIDSTATSHNLYWLFYLLPLLGLDEFSRDSAVPGLNREDAYANMIPLPPPAEQTAIAAYLDRKTAQIDTLIERKRRLIQLLQEERTALISQAVTKGLAGLKIDWRSLQDCANLPPDYKDSGVEWIGEVPEGWEVVKLKYLAHIKYGLGQPPRQLDGGLPLIRATNVSRGKITETDLVFVDPADVPYARDPLLKTDDIIVVRSGAYTGDSAIIPSKFNGAVTGYDMVVRMVDVLPKLIAYVLLSNYVLQNQIFLHRLRAAQPHLNAEELGETLILVPPAKEQTAIVAYLDEKTAQIDQTIARAERQIELLQEYRTALISAAVTGKIDVREE